MCVLPGRGAGRGWGVRAAPPLPRYVGCPELCVCLCFSVSLSPPPFFLCLCLSLSLPLPPISLTHTQGLSAWRPSLLPAWRSQGNLGLVAASPSGGLRQDWGSITSACLVRAHRRGVGGGARPLLVGGQPSAPRGLSWPGRTVSCLLDASSPRPPGPPVTVWPCRPATCPSTPRRKCREHVAPGHQTRASSRLAGVAAVPVRGREPGLRCPSIPAAGPAQGDLGKVFLFKGLSPQPQGAPPHQEGVSLQRV